MTHLALSVRIAACALVSAIVPTLVLAQPVGVERRSAVDVRVTNTPLPVTGRLNIGNTAANPLYIRDVDGPARQPFSFFGRCDVNNSFICPIAVPTVPAGKRLVLQHVNGFVNVPFGTRIQEFSLLLGNSLVSLPPQLVSSGSRTVYSINEAVLAYLEPGTTLSVNPSVEGNGLVATVLLSGYFVDLN